MKKNITQKEINIAGVRTTPSELLKEFLINFAWAIEKNTKLDLENS